ncbi:MAG: YhdP family protein [Pseudohongiella sp.]|uniref:YhdP family protein n=1 Tax=Pseudohongiella sp. TaxID=1979412 RepID=UPI00349FD276
MSKSIGRAMLQVSFTVLLVMLVALALYVSLGRQLAPMVGNYTGVVEQRLSQMLDADVRIGSIEGDWERFGPRFIVHDLQINARTDEESAPLLLERVSFAPDMTASLRQLRPVLGRTTVEQLDLALYEQDGGGWALAGIIATGPEPVSSAQVLEWLKSLALIELVRTRLAFHHNNGEISRFTDATLRFQSLNGRHAVELSAEQEGIDAALFVQGELIGDSIAQMQGEIYASLPGADYSDFLHRFQPAGVAVNDMTLNGELWLGVQRGNLASAVWRGSADLELEREAGSRLQNLSIGWLKLEHLTDDGSWQLDVEDFAFDAANGSWPSGGITAHYREGVEATMHIDAVDMGLASRLIQALAPEGVLRDETERFNPRGLLQNLRINAELNGDAIQTAELKANLSAAAISAHRGAPAFWGVDGYVELAFDADQRIAEGFVEVDSDDITVQLPSLFNDQWVYQRLNGRMGFRADWTSDLNIHLASTVVVAESADLRARARFSTEIQSGDNRYINLELMIGALSADVSQKSLYLPTAPNAPQSAQGILQWVNDAVVDGEAAGSGLIFRGRVQQGAGPRERTLQMFYKLADGTLKFAEEWPAIEALDGVVTIDNGAVDIAASAGSSLGISFNSSIASVRASPEGGSWLTVSGDGRGSAQQGLRYLQATPVTQGIGQYLSTWQAQGETDFKLALSIPLSVDNAQPQIDLAFAFEDNSIFMPEFELDVGDLSGRLLYSSSAGLESQNMTATLLGDVVDVQIRADGMEGEPEGASVSVSGKVAMAALAGWPGMPALVSGLLAEAEGESAYTAEVRLPIYGDSGISNGLLHPRLRINSDLDGVAFSLPAPFAKAEDETRSFTMTLDFIPLAPSLGIALQDVVQMNLSLRDSNVYNGLIYFGATDDGLRVRRLNESAPGVSVLGTIPEINVDSWTDAIARLTDNSDSNRAAGAGFDPGFTGSAELMIGRLAVFDETFENVSVQLAEENDIWTLGLTSDSIAGMVRPPSGDGEPWDISLDHLHLSRSIDGEVEDEVAVAEQPDIDVADTEAETGTVTELDLQELPTVEFILPRTDPLANLDPRQFPNLRLAIDELTMAGSSFGQWQFLMQPDAQGARFSDLIVDARGLRIGSEEEPATFRWNYDGDVHDSEFTGIVGASDLAAVLSAFGYAPTIQSASARFDSSLHWRGSPAYFSALGLNGEINLEVNNGRFQQRAGVANSALRLISIINFDAVLRRLRFSDDITGSGLAYDEIRGKVELEDGILSIEDRLQIIGPSSLFQIAGEVDLAAETIDGDLYITLPISDNIPWLSGLAALNNLINWQVAVGVFLFDQIFGEQVDDLTSAHYTLDGPWEGLEPRLNQVFTGGGS